jgi:hypothetical protein
MIKGVSDRSETQATIISGECAPSNIGEDCTDSRSKSIDLLVYLGALTGQRICTAYGLIYIC